jgi:hypothetical protein
MRKWNTNTKVILIGCYYYQFYVAYTSKQSYKRIVLILVNYPNNLQGENKKPVSYDLPTTLSSLHDCSTQEWQFRADSC